MSLNARMELLHFSNDHSFLYFGPHVGEICSAFLSGKCANTDNTNLAGYTKQMCSFVFCFVGMLKRSYWAILIFYNVSVNYELFFPLWNLRLLGKLCYINM